MPPLLYPAVLERHKSKYKFIQDLFSYAYAIFFRVTRNAFCVEALKCSQSLLAPHLFCSGSVNRTESKQLEVENHMLINKI